MSTVPINILLNVSNFSVGYQHREQQNILFENLTVSLRSHELVCFMGPNGIGKSTLLRTLAGLQAPLNNNVYSPPNPQTLAVVLTDRITAVNMSVRELIAFGRYPYLNWNISLTAEDQHFLDKAIALTRIEGLLQKKIYELSDGQMQMVMIARALAQNTPMLLLDEPTAHLDLNNRVEIMNLLRNLARHEGKAILVSTHELDLALQTADLIWLAGKNKNILTGLPEDLVLSGVFDELFQLKGFDLKTGRVEHEAWRGVAVNLQGDGPEYLWTKNALERNGYRVESKTNTTIAIHKTDNALFWELNGQTFQTLHQLLDGLKESNVR